MKLAILLFLFSISNVSLAVSDTFTVGVAVGSDVTPPSIPAPVNATSVSFSQIDISWGVSTDDQLLLGYRLFRNNVQIATTSLTSYSDTDLLPDTSYSYTVEAYDSSLNISTTSTDVTATTFKVPQKTTGTLLQLRLLNLSINSDETSVEISWQTNQYGQYTLRWGKDNVYDGGFVSNGTFRKTHKTKITDLEPGSTYMYELIGYTRMGREVILSRDSFTTNFTADRTAPLNISSLKAIVEGVSVRLLWKNPSDSDFYKVRIVRNNMFYPKDISDGYIVYQGVAESFRDLDIFQISNFQYYTIFTYDTSGNISSGVVIDVPKQVDTQTSLKSDNSDPGNMQQNENKEPDSTSNIDFSDVVITQNNIPLGPINQSILIDKDTPITMSIPYNVLPENLKTIIVTITKSDSDIESVSFLLRVNKDKTAYQAVVPPFMVEGKYLLDFTVYNYDTQLLNNFNGDVTAGEMIYSEKNNKQVFYTKISPTVFVYSFFWLLIITLTLMYFLLDKHKRKV